MRVATEVALKYSVSEPLQWVIQ